VFICGLLFVLSLGDSQRNIFRPVGVTYCMKSTVLLLFLSVALACAATAADISGKWSGTFVAENGDSGSAYVILKQSGSTITGSGGPDANEQWPAL
jgi:hypothetical protein